MRELVVKIDQSFITSICNKNNSIILVSTETFRFNVNHFHLLDCPGDLTVICVFAVIVVELPEVLVFFFIGKRG